MSIFKGKQKAWAGLLVPIIVPAILAGLEAGLGIKFPPEVQIGIIAALTGGTVYQVANAK